MGRVRHSRACASRGRKTAGIHTAFFLAYLVGLAQFYSSYTRLSRSRKATPPNTQGDPACGRAHTPTPGAHGVGTGYGRWDLERRRKAGCAAGQCCLTDSRVFALLLLGLFSMRNSSTCWCMTIQTKKVFMFCVLVDMSARSRNKFLIRKILMQRCVPRTYNASAANSRQCNNMRII